MWVDSTVFINFAKLPGNVHFIFSLMEYFRMQGYETYNYSNVFKYGAN